jgi:hypothetical protein
MDEVGNVVNYNWIVDGILKNSTPYDTHKDASNLTNNRGRKKQDKPCKDPGSSSKRNKKALLGKRKSKDEVNERDDDNFEEE